MQIPPGLMAWQPPADLPLTLALVFAAQRFFAAWGPSIWTDLCNWGGPHAAEAVLVYVRGHGWRVTRVPERR